MNYHFRNATLEDLDFIIYLIEVSFKDCIVKTWRKWDIEEQYTIWKEKLSSEKKFKIIQEKDRDIWLFYMENSEKDINLEGLFLLPEFQGKWIGSDIIGHLIEISLSEWKSLSLQSLKSNTKAITLYKKLWFVIINESPERYYFMYERKI